jgi:hypothetical protein
MGVKVCYQYGHTERVFPDANDWYAGEDKTLQIYQEHDGNPQFVIAEYADGCWESVEHDPLPSPQPEDPGSADEADRDAHNPELKGFK